MKEVEAMTRGAFRKNVERQFDLLNEGKPLEAFDRFFASNGVMYANGDIFARGAVEGRKKQEPYIRMAETVTGNIVDLVVPEEKEVCAFRNRTSFVTASGKKLQIDGVCWQLWRNGMIAEERYFDGETMEQMQCRGILTFPEKLI